MQLNIIKNLFSINELFINNNDEIPIYHTYSFYVTQEQKNYYVLKTHLFNKNWTNEQLIDFEENSEEKNIYHSREIFCVKIKTTIINFIDFESQFFKYLQILKILDDKNHYKNLECNLLSIGEIIYHIKHVNPEAKNFVKINNRRNA